jgi:hypothetical protein
VTSSPDDAIVAPVARTMSITPAGHSIEIGHRVAAEYSIASRLPEMCRASSSSRLRHDE